MSLAALLGRTYATAGTIRRVTQTLRDDGFVEVEVESLCACQDHVQHRLTHLVRSAELEDDVILSAIVKCIDVAFRRPHPEPR